MQSSQLSSLTQMFGNETNQSQWVVKFKDKNFYMYAVKFSKGIVFSNLNGDYVFFDGWVIKKFRFTSSSEQTWEIMDDKFVRTFRKSNGESESHECQKWTSQIKSGTKRFLQTCSNNGGYENDILVSQDGYIQDVRQVVTFRNEVMTLRRLDY